MNIQELKSKMQGKMFSSDINSTDEMWVKVDRVVKCGRDGYTVYYTYNESNASSQRALSEFKKMYRFEVEK